MNFTMKKKDSALILSSGLLMNSLFLLFLMLTVYFIITNYPPTPWSLTLLLVTLTGSTYRETWRFDERGASYRFSLFLIPLQRKNFPRAETEKIHLTAFIRGRQGFREPGSERSWFQKEQGLLKIIGKDGTEELIQAGTNRQSEQLRARGEEIAAQMEIPFLLNE
jgi:hypothetical protein